MVEHNPNHKGNVAELVIAAEAAALGLSVLKPMTEHEIYDLALDLGQRILRVQCKWATYKNGVVHIHVGRCRTKRRGYARSTYQKGEIDALAAYCKVLDRCYLLPEEMVVGRYGIQLRTEPARNNQRAAINFAADYELGAVAQLEERRLGRAEATGSNPVSSTSQLNGKTDLVFPDRDGFKDLKRIVGMDEFDTKLAQYVRLAESGEEIQVTRWGKPVAKLSPPVP
jgi:hypothetical protein